MPSEYSKILKFKLEKVLIGSNSLKSKVDNLDAEKLVPVPVDLSK